ncbi:MAG: cation diffusion facilitator family transporter [Candidatus Heimdallarchaeota archaeon]|nr:MAG: cation diffusion facilitator family transporter [Candidatus Heimdallarchaeota archaeon]
MVGQPRKDLFAEGEKATLVTILCNILLTVFKIITGLFIGSVALLASGFDALTDFIASFAVLIGLRFAQKDPSKRFPYGYYRMETLATLIVAIIILLFGIEVLVESYGIIIDHRQITYPVLGLVVSLISFLVAFGLYRYNLRIGTKITSNALISTAKEFQLDIFVNALVFIGILAHLLEFQQFEGIVGLFIGILILKTGLEFGRVSLFTLLDALDDPEIIERIQLSALEVSKVQEVPNVRIRRSGPYYFADIEIRMSARETVESLAQVTHDLESHLKNKIPQLDSIMVSVEPIIKTRLLVAFPVPSFDTTLEEVPAEHFGLAPAFLIAELDILTFTIISKQSVENPHWKAERKRGILAAKLLVKKDIDVFAVKNSSSLGLGPKAVFKEKNVLLHNFGEGTIRQVLEEFMISKAKTQESNNSFGA